MHKRGYSRTDVKGQKRGLALAGALLHPSPKGAGILRVPAPLQLMQQHVNCLEKR